MVGGGNEGVYRGEWIYAIGDSYCTGKGAIADAVHLPATCWCWFARDQLLNLRQHHETVSANTGLDEVGEAISPPGCIFETTLVS